MRRLLTRDRSKIEQPLPAPARDRLLSYTESFADASTLAERTAAFSVLIRWIWTARREREFAVRLERWLRMMERDDALRLRLQHSFAAMLADLDSLGLFTEAGLPSHHALFSEGVRRVVQRWLPSARTESDAARLLVTLFSSPREVERFLNLPEAEFARLATVLWPEYADRLLDDLRQALCLVATRIAGRGTTRAVRDRGTAYTAEESPFYQLIFSTEALVHAGDTVLWQFAHWTSVVRRCREELEEVHLHMESAGVSADLVYDLRTIEHALDRMEALAGALAPQDSRINSARRILDQLVAGRLEDSQVAALFRQNLNLLARKTVERTGRGGEHYIAHTRLEYWQMWKAALGGGLLTVLTAALKMRITESHLPLFVEGFLSGTNYAVSFVLLQVFGLALATKQPSMTAATLAGIIRSNRGYARWSKISDFVADISRTQLAAAMGNVIAVTAGSIALERLWRGAFSQSYLGYESARHVYQTLHPFTSGTVFYAALTGVILWLAALIGGWFENFAVYHKLTDAVAQHPFGIRAGESTMRRMADGLERNLAGWSTSIALGYLLGFTPVLGRFFGIPLDVRHVTLTTGTLALAVARFGTGSFDHDWFYYAIAGIGVTFVLNLSVSFSIAGMVALRAYDVPRREQRQLLGYIAQQILRSPLRFVLPIDDRATTAAVSEETQR
jgi:site-specific recombinase